MPQIRRQSEKKRSELISRTSLLIFGTTILYLLVALVQGVRIEPILFSLFGLASVVTFYINRAGKTGVAKVFSLLSFNILLFLAASSEPLETGIHLHFIEISTIALVLFGYEEWPKGVAFVALSLSLYILVYFGDVSILPHRVFTPSQARWFFSLNIALTSSVSTYSVLLASRLNFETENILRSNERLSSEQNELLQKTNEELDRFVYSVSHDLRAPLSSISGLIYLAEKSAGEKSEEIKQYLSMMKGSIERLELFIRNIINFSRNARVELKQESVSLNVMVQEVYESLRFGNGSSSVELIKDLDLKEIFTDKSRLQIVLFNLISNAIQYRDPQKPRSFIRISSYTKNSQAVIEVEDNGIGISLSHHNRVFDMFYRASENSKGSGLGLYIAKEAMEKLGGAIALQSEPGKGTQFILALPVTVPENDRVGEPVS